MEGEVASGSHEPTLPTNELCHRPKVLIEQIHCDLAVCQCCLVPIPDELQHVIGGRSTDPQTEIIDLAR